MTKTAAELKLELDDARAEVKKAQAKCSRAYKAWDKARQRELGEVDLATCTHDEFKAVMESAWSESWAHELVSAFFRPLAASGWFGELPGGFYVPLVTLCRGQDPKPVHDRLVVVVGRLKEVYGVDEVYVSILERTLSEYGVYSLVVTNVDHAIIQKTTRGRTEQVCPPAPLLQQLETIAERFNYGDEED